MIRGVLATILFSFATLTRAQLCGLEPSPVLRFVPEAPLAGQTFVAVVGSLTLAPIEPPPPFQGVVIVGADIYVYVPGTRKPTASYPIDCVAIPLGPLPSGSYTVHFREIVPGLGGNPVAFELAASTLILGSVMAESIPASGPVGLAILAIVLSVVAIPKFRHGERERPHRGSLRAMARKVNSLQRRQEHTAERQHKRGSLR